jgi:antitoxin component YwqK of YwqJK toxin-antitoxin module
MSNQPKLGFAAHSVQQDLDAGAHLEPAKDVRGKILYVPPSEVKSGIDVQRHEAEAAKYDDAIKNKNYSQVEDQIRAVKTTTPSYNEAEASTIARAMSRDHRHVVAANEAAQNNNHVRVVHEDGSYEQGIVKPSANEGPKREGTWHRVDSQGTTVQVADFKDGQLHGEARFYDRNNQMTHRGYYQEGKAQDTHYDYADVDGKRRAVHKAVYDKGEFKEEMDVQAEPAKRAQARGPSH